MVSGGAFDGVENKVSPFGYKRGEGADAGADDPEWIVSKERYKYDNLFETLNPVDGKVNTFMILYNRAVLRLAVHRYLTPTHTICVFLSLSLSLFYILWVLMQDS